MLAFFIKLLLAHILGDFLFQPSKWVKHKLKKKHKSKYLYYHILVHVLVLTAVLEYNFRDYWLGFIIIITSHYIIDLIKLRFTTKKNSRLLFLLDQLAHLIVLGLVVKYYFPELFDLSILLSPESLVFITFLLLSTSVASVCMRIIISKWDLDTSDEAPSDSLAQAGAYIGILERIFVFIFIITDHWEGVGFLMAAKSIFRFGDLSKAKDRKLTEYVLIGTLVSFGFAILSGIGYLYFMQQLS